MSEESLSPEISQVQKSVVIWGIAAFAFAILAVTQNTSAMVLGASFFGKFFGVIVGTVLGTVGALIGDAIRRFAHPDGVITDGGMGTIIWIKLFWKAGPQIIGLVIGVCLGVSLVLN
jgi:hypothetical protein